jgi:hypothetical protein
MCPEKLAGELSDGGRGVGGPEMGQCRIVIVTGLLKMRFWNVQGFKSGIM